MKHKYKKLFDQAYNHIINTFKKQMDDIEYLKKDQNYTGEIERVLNSISETAKNKEEEETRIARLATFSANAHIVNCMRVLLKHMESIRSCTDVSYKIEIELGKHREKCDTVECPIKEK